MKTSKKMRKLSILILIITILSYSLLNLVCYHTSNAANQVVSDKYTNLNETEYPGIKEKIQVLKNKYPNWNFKILYTDLDWNEVIANEFQGHGASPKNLVYNKENYKGEWICPICGDKPYDNGSWRCASEAAISYMMDPRNSLNDSDIFQFEELTASKSDIKIVTSMATGTYLAGHEQAIVDIANKNGINAYYIVARLIQEQGKQGSELVSGKSGYYNAFNIGAAGNTSTEIIQNGLAYAKRKGWDTLEKSIEGGIGFVANEYIKKGQSTLYLQKFNVTTSNGPYSHQYQQNLTAAQTEGTTLRDTYINTNSMTSSHTFIIPVYKNMPAQACARPDGSATETTESDLVKVNVENSLKIRKSPTDNTAVGWLWKGEIVTRLKKATTKIGGTYWDIVQKADGTTGYSARETFEDETPYKLYLVPVEDNSSNNNSGNNSNNNSNNNSDNESNNNSNNNSGEEIKIKDTEKVKLDENKKQLIVKPEAIAKDILDACGGSIKIVDVNGNYLEKGELTDIATGFVVADKYAVVKKGDVNGDGIINSADLLAVQKHLLKIKNIAGTVYGASADLNKDDTINSADLLKIQKYLLGVSSIEI